MYLVIIIVAIFVNKLIANALGYHYNLFTDPFNIKLLLVDILLFAVVYVVLAFSYQKIKQFTQHPSEKGK